MFVLILTLLAQLPVIVDGTHQLHYDTGMRSGDPILVVDGLELLHYGMGPNEIRPHTLHYDWVTGTAYIGEDDKGYWLDRGSKQPRLEKLRGNYRTLVGSWGIYRIYVYHDYKKDRNAGGRIVLESEGQNILISNLTATQAAMHPAIRLFAGRSALVIADNFTRAIGYIPLVNGGVESKRVNGQLTPAAMVTFPMPHDFRDRPLKLGKRKANENLMIGEIMEVEDGIYVLTGNNEMAYVYDLTNTTSFYLGHFVHNGALVGARDGKLLVSDFDADKMVEIDPFKLMEN